MSHVNRNLSTISSAVWSMQVAFASSDYHHVDQHFGATPRLVVYGVKQHEVKLLKVVDFNVEYGHGEDKLASRIDALDACVTLYCVAIGETVFRQLLQVGVRAIRVPEATSIAQLLQQIQQCWADSEHATRRRQRDPDRFQQFIVETEWREEDDAS
ncbi:NifB/NifX family molybdenum-iron cluster-binding protein [Pectobacterium polaris]|uniref:Nitrogen fixation protein NifX n=1 Tax=Pectobacterium polaris TaxID=2042057 RepID=A0AAW5G890_9GAMM|nr:NifB/NifX family molybdenum-iron cluster-binding protein [Pectobacterium polaris]MBN3216264.1 nitrogen fixation protein NifX [Pectobacterium polaris]MCA6940243.1 NifB/NifX family molybdenum-iron cluster-binding protein [Pectobacterium polaris]MCA6957825.1 NifB/NifX family molybdenum-iron cluster-binding protein [Pectobacterium polaris]MCL6350200.1 nitrogen fixation protein NifX [Pectobacterium polaris]MCL6367876.1 nitrogen fixation protein NifX [Pectobacterium polaris]